MAEVDETIGADEFERWLTPRQCHTLLQEQWDNSVIRTTLMDHCAHELMLARAETMFVSGGYGKEAKLERTIVPKVAWMKGERPAYNDDFWDNGRHDFDIGYGQSGKNYFCFGVRFDPEAVNRLIEVNVIRQHKEVLLTEEAAKTALVMPFLQAMGFNVFNPAEVIPEFTCDVGTKKGEKVDYALCIDGKRVVLRDQKSYAAVLLDDNNRKTLARLHFNSASVKYLGTFIGKDETRQLIADPVDIYAYSKEILARIAELDGSLGSAA